MSAPISDAPPLRGAKLALGAFALALANFIVVLDMSIANVSVPHIAGGLAVSPSQGTWAITSYAVADAITVPLTGWLAARYGSVRWFVVSLISFGLFSMLCGLATTLPALVLFRILQGLSGGPLMPLSQTLLLRVFPKERAGAALGIWAMTTTAAPIFGPILGGIISDNWSWPWIFFINLPVVALCVFGALRIVAPYETAKAKTRIDIIGLSLLVVWVGAFQLMLDTGREHDWFGSAWIIALAIMAAIGFAAFVIWEYTDSDPVVDVRIFRHRSFVFPSVAIMLGFGAFFAQVVLTPLWLQQTLGFTATNAAYVVAWVGLFAILCSPIAAKLAGRVDLRITVSLGILWLCAMSLLRAHWTAGADYWTLALPHILQGAGMPFFFIGLTALALGAVPQKEVVSAAGIMSFMRTLSTAVGTALATNAWDEASGVARVEAAATLNDPQSALAALQSAGLASEQALTTLSWIVEVQATTVGVLQVYLMAAAIFVLAAAMVWMTPKPAGRIRLSAAEET